MSAMTRAGAIRAGRRSVAHWKREGSSNPERYQILRHAGGNKDDWFVVSYKFNEPDALRAFQNECGTARPGSAMALFGHNQLVRFEWAPQVMRKR